MKETALKRSDTPIRRSPMRRPTTRPKERPTGPCAYCGGRAVHADHVVPKSLQRKLRRMGRPLPAHLTGTVACCGSCNWLKLTRRLVPPSWAHLVPELNDLIPGTWFRVWQGGTDEPAFREVHR